MAVVTVVAPPDFAVEATNPPDPAALAPGRPPPLFLFSLL